MEHVVTFLWRAGLRGRPAGYPPGALRRNSNIRKYVACKLRFPHTKEFLRTLPTILACVVKMVRQARPRPRATNYWPARGVHMFRAEPAYTYVTALCYIYDMIL
jgi:hypothetical protein